MRLQTPLDDLVPTRSHVRLLRALAQLPDGMPASGRELARRAGVAHATAARILSDLRDQGIVITRRYGRADMHQLNAEHVLHPLIRDLFAREQVIPAQLRGALRDELERAGGITHAYLYGSAARGDMGASSDIDVAVVAPTRKESELAPILERFSERIRRRFGSDVSVLVGRKPPRRGDRGAWGQVAREGIPLVRDGQRERAQTT